MAITVVTIALTLQYVQLIGNAQADVATEYYETHKRLRDDMSNVGTSLEGWEHVFGIINKINSVIGGFKDSISGQMTRASGAASQAFSGPLIGALEIADEAFSGPVNAGIRIVMKELSQFKDNVVDQIFGPDEIVNEAQTDSSAVDNPTDARGSANQSSQASSTTSVSCSVSTATVNAAKKNHARVRELVTAAFSKCASGSKSITLKSSIGSTIDHRCTNTANNLDDYFVRHFIYDGLVNPYKLSEDAIFLSSSSKPFLGRTNLHGSGVTISIATNIGSESCGSQYLKSIVKK